MFPLIALFSLTQLLIEMLHSIGTVLAHFLSYMSVSVQGELSGCMTQIGLYSFDVISCIEGGNGKTVTKIVKPGIVRDFCPLNNLLEMLHNRAPD